MENPVTEVSHVIRALVQSTPSVQRATIERYFTADASFTHPFCRTGSFNGSRWLIWCIYRWYKIMSPKIEIDIDSIAFDAPNLILYVSMHQIFRIWLIPGYAAPVKLVTVLKLAPFISEKHKAHSEGHGTVYRITSQNDLYQVNEFVTFWSPLRLLWLIVLVLQWGATVCCVLGTWLGGPVTWVEENMVGGNSQRKIRDVLVAS